MAKILSSSEVERYHRDGFVFPVPVLGCDEVRDLRADLGTGRSGKDMRSNIPRRASRTCCTAGRMS